ncbi:DEKNAAC100292 [Brettanomyces naardenensis]|uniref:DEKNAAC100292 n=1 Tax=Brettanomyces naardenensis TaxID=13370 RepID=A0A448YEH7_BRENA|nr:DEKNAAC100292 [Brettanomyces naardenensis]
MDSLGKTLNNLSLYEVKHYVRKAQNAVLNLSEIESKVREATNNEPWGASSSTMAEIARGTFNYKDREEICNMIFRRFTEKSAHEWRQIYKALQLMEYLVKHGSERFVDDARANVSLVSMLKSFHYIDSKGVDQGINVRNRARELAALLNDEAKIRQERRTAKDNAKKFGAISSNAYSLGSSRSGRVGGSLSSGAPDGVAVSVGEDGYEARVFGDGGVYGQRYGDTAQNHVSGSRRKGRAPRYEEYAVEDDTHRRSRRTSKPTVETSTATAQVDLVSFADGENGGEAAPEAENESDDDFDDFQSVSAAPAQSNNLADILAASYSRPSQSSQVPQQAHSIQSKQLPSLPIPQSKPKKDDLFGSLLASAKTSTSSKPSKQSFSHSTSPAQPAQPVRVQSSQSTRPQNGAVNLLDL